MPLRSRNNFLSPSNPTPVLPSSSLLAGEQEAAAATTDTSRLLQPIGSSHRMMSTAITSHDDELGVDVYRPTTTASSGHSPTPQFSKAQSGFEFQRLGSPMDASCLPFADGVEAASGVNSEAVKRPAVGITSVAFANSTLDPSAVKLTFQKDNQHLGMDIVDSNTCTTIVTSDRSWTPSLTTMKNKIQNSEVWLSIRCFCAAMCILIWVHGALTTGYITSVITTIEKRFEIRSRTSGLVISSYELGSLFSVLLVSYFGSRGHIPRFIGMGAMFMATGSFLFALPHFLAHPPMLNASVINKMPDMCTKEGFGTTPLSTGDAQPLVDDSEPCVPRSLNSAGNYVFIVILAQILLGVGGSPMFTLGTTYIDNHVSKENSSVYLAFMYVMLAIGPVCGFLFGALMLSKYLSPPRPADLPDSAFVGLWWAGFLALGLGYLLAGLPFFGFPRRLPIFLGGGNAEAAAGAVTPTEADEQSSTNDGRELRETVSTSSASGSSTIKDIPFSIARLLRNSVYMTASLNACMDLAIVSGFTTYLPKYLETQFELPRSTASVLTGAVAVPGAIVGICTGGAMMKRYRLQLRGASTMVVVINGVALCFLSLFFFFGCDNLRLAGVFSKYNRFEPYPNPFQKTSLNLSDPCNAACDCSPQIYQPVCGVDGKTYFSPCFAGCTHMQSTVVRRESIRGPVDLLQLNYTDCSCIRPSTTNNSVSSGFSQKPQDIVASLHACRSGCGMLPWFLVLLFLLTSVASNNQMPLVMITLRAVSEGEKAFALGLQVVMLRLFAYMPAPILFGSIIDTTCLVWKPMDELERTCGPPTDGTACLLYDIETFRMRYGFIAIILKVVAACLSVLLWVSIHRRYEEGGGELAGAPDPFSPPITMSEVAHRLGEFDNLHIRDSACQRHMGGLRSWLSDDSLYSRARSPKRHQKTMSC